MTIAKIDGVTWASVAKNNGIAVASIAKIDGQAVPAAGDFLNLTTFSETDPNSNIAVTSTKVTANGILRNETAYLVYDYGAEYFGDFDIDFEGYFNSSSDANCRFAMGFTDTLDESASWIAPQIGVRFQDIAGSYRLRLNVNANSLTYTCSQDTLYYLSLVRTGINVYLYTYSDSDRTTLVNTQSDNGAGTEKYRYLYAMASHDISSTAKGDGYFQNFKIN